MKSASTKSGRRILALVTDAHGGHGGISQFNRDALEAMCAFDTVDEVHVIARIAAQPLGTLPIKLRYHLDGVGSIAHYVKEVVSCAVKMGPFDLIFCGHINLLPISRVAARITSAPIVMAIHGIDAWKPTKRASCASIIKGVAGVIAVSQLTMDRFRAWCTFPKERMHLVPNAIRMDAYGVRKKDAALLKRLGLIDRTVLLTVGRMASEERAKGFDEVIELLPNLSKIIPNISYVAAGGGSDLLRLQSKAERLRVADRVIFTGRFDDLMKPDLFALADVYVMPSHGEGFGIVILEALASGIPVVASNADGTREAIRDGKLGILVDPCDAESIQKGILDALRRPRQIPEGLEYFSYDKFSLRLRQALSAACQL